MKCLLMFLALTGTALFAGDPPTKFNLLLKAQAFAKAIETHIQSGDGVLLDLRTPDEYEEGYISGAENVNFYDETFKDQLKAMPRDKTYLIYCRSGGRSGRTAKLMAELGFKRVYDLKGGMNAWKAAKQAVAQ